MLVTFKEFYNLWKNREKKTAKYLLQQVDASQVRLYEKYARAKAFEVKPNEKIDS